jgi:hypothetical protein
MTQGNEHEQEKALSLRENGDGAHGDGHADAMDGVDSLSRTNSSCCSPSSKPNSARRND